MVFYSSDMVRSLRRGCLSVLAIAAALALPAQSQTLEEAFATAYATNPTLIAARAGVRAVDEDVPLARSGMLPNVAATATVGVEDTSINGAPSGSTQEPRSVALSATQVLYDGGQTQNSIDGAVAGVDAARAQLTDTEQSILLQVVTAYSNVLRDQEFVMLGENNVRVIAEQLRAAEDRFVVGEVTRTDVSQAQAALAESEASLAVQVGALARSFQTYGSVVGAPPGTLAPLPPLPELPPTLADAVQEAMDNNPAINAARYAEEQSRSDIAVAQGALLPTVTLSGSVSYGEDQSAALSNGITSAQVQLQASIPLYQGGAAYSNVRRAQAIQSQAMTQIHESTRAIRLQVENAWTDIETARIAIRAGRQQVAAAQVAFEGVREEAKLGARTTLDVLDAEQDLLTARSNVVASLRDEYVAAFALMSALGRLTVNGLGVNVEPYDPNANYEINNARRFGFERDELTKWKTKIAP
ncbi:MAG: TolC family outer membrane protein [Pseudomonadota bacterium]